MRSTCKVLSDPLGSAPISSIEATAPQGEAQATAGCLHDLFSAQAQRTPDAIALTFGSNSLSYTQLDQRSNALAHHLSSLGLGPETPVTLYLDRSLEMIVAILGVLKAGGAYVPIDLAYPQDRAAFMIKDSGAKVLLTTSALRANLPLEVPTTVCLDSDWETIGASSEPPEVLLSPENAAYIIYTSGSTGVPKGVLVTHHNVVRLLQQTQPWYQFSETDIWPLFHSYAFDVSVWEIWASLLNGGRLVIVPYLVTRSPSDFYALLSTHGITVLNQTPSAFRQLIWAEANAPERLPLKLRYVICAGEALELQSLRPWFEIHGDQRPTVVNMYGITETTVHSTYRPIRMEDVERNSGSLIGVPIPDLQLYLVDEELKPVPEGTPGEICVGGAGVARGYLNRPELTGKRFLPDPFSTSPKARMYRSGDLAMYLPGGELAYLGRIDHQVKIRGFRVELGEIESALNRHPQLQENVVVALDRGTGEKRLVAYAVARDAEPSVSELRAHLRQSLPDYMIPAAFVFLNRLPLTTNGKVDRRALPEPGGERPVMDTPFANPKPGTEQKLAEIWQDVLGVSPIGSHDNYFELGGDSIRSILMLARAQETGIVLSLEDVFGFPTIAELAARARTTSGSEPFAKTEPMQLVSKADQELLPPHAEDAYPIGSLQLGMFFRNELSPTSAIYHDVFSFRVASAFKSEPFLQASQRLSRRHAILRTSFHLSEFSEPLQIVHREAVTPITVEDLRGLTEHEQSARIKAWVDAEKRRPFNRKQAPLVRFHICVLADQSFQFVFSFHHSCLDGWSLAAAVTELLQDYAALCNARQLDLPAPRVAYREFIALELQAKSSAAQREFWKDQLKGVQTPLLPRWPEETRAGGLEQMRGPEVEIDPAVLARLQSLCATLHVPLKTLLFAAHLRVMNLLYGRPDVITGLISNGRPERLDGERIIGLFLNAVTVRLDLSGGSWKELVLQTFAAEQTVLPFRRFPIAELQRINHARPLFETAFDFVHFHVYRRLKDRQDIDLTEGHYFEANDMATYTTFMLSADSKRLELHIDYDPERVAEAQVKPMTAYYVRALESIAKDPESRYEREVPLEKGEKELVLRGWNSSQDAYPSSLKVHELFEAWARRLPHEIAVIQGEKRLTYGELDQRASWLASLLRARGLKHQDRLGICLDRSPDMLVALIASMKAGAVYVPLDPAYPAHRLEAMVEDAQPRFVLTEQKFAQLFQATSSSLFLLDEPATALATDPEESSPTQGSSADLAYVIYTSGSTGKPKGVQVKHRSVVNLLCSVADRLGVTAKDQLLAVTTLSFDIAALELFLPLITGGKVYLCPREIAADGRLLEKLVTTTRPSLMQATPATWQLLVEAGWQGNKDLKVISGGEALKQRLADQLLDRAVEVWNFYGPTETTIWSSCWKVSRYSPISIGGPLANTCLYILDQHRQPVPIGTVGELYIGGDGVALGYLNRPELTAERFMLDPFATGGEARMYRTGDLARHLPDGNIVCLGRIDQQVKIHGFRIEPAEIEGVLREYPSVADAVVTAREDATGSNRLVAYIVSRNGLPDLGELRHFVGSRVPYYMVPSHVVCLDHFPMTPNGKVDLLNLPPPEQGRLRPTGYTPPRTDLETRVSQIWGEVLAVEQVGAEDNFFELGGDSLSATRAFSRINDAFGTEVALQELFEHPTLSDFARVLKERGTVPVQSQSHRIPRQPRRVPVA